MKALHALTLTLAALCAAAPAFANDAHHPAAGASAAAIASADAPLSEGEVKKVDKDAGKITIKHGPLANLDMPAMTMVFRAKDPAMLTRVKPGDRIRFEAGKENGQFVVVSLQPGA